MDVNCTDCQTQSLGGYCRFVKDVQVLKKNSEKCSRWRNGFLDSKGKHLKTVIPGRLRVRIHIYNQSGADISSDIVRTAMNRIRLAQEPIILIWFGTCELSVKNGNFRKL
jgi:hypothetical protein